jgi:hypothetical protein
MARILDDGIGNVTAALKAADLWADTLMLFAADNGGWAADTGSNNYPLKGSKVSDFEGGVRVVSFLAGGFLPSTVHGTHHTGYISIADWCGFLLLPSPLFAVRVVMFAVRVVMFAVRVVMFAVRVVMFAVRVVMFLWQE